MADRTKSDEQQIVLNPFFRGRAIDVSPVVGHLAEQISYPNPSLPGTMGLLRSGNIPTGNRPVVHNLDASHSTLRSGSFGGEQGTALLPTVSEQGGIFSPQQAWADYQRTGRNLGTFANQQDADAYSQALHEQQERMKEFY